MPQEPVFSGYNLVDAFGPLSFDQPVAMASPPGETNRLFIVERLGRISVITNLAAPSHSVFLNLPPALGTQNIEAGLLGMAFHPGYATNRLFYVFRASLLPDIGFANTILRYETSLNDPNTAAPESEVVIMSFPDPSNEHNGGDLIFGPDGYLYISMGDIGLGVETQANPQPLDRSFFGGVLRIDVDQNPSNLPPNPLLGGTLNYRVPADNPFIGITSYQGFAIDPAKLRTEFYAVGFRNPWRMSYDRESGTLFCGDVGGAEVEEVNIITAGSNYGWPYLEGNLPYVELGSVPTTFPFTPPIVSYRHGRGTNEGVAIVGGVVYRGSTIPTLAGGYLFADNVRGHLWVTYPFDDRRTNGFQRLIMETGIAAFGTDPRDKEVLVINHQNGSLKRLVWAMEGNVPTNLTLAGVFSDLNTLKPSLGVEPYEISLPFWSDHAIKSRYFSLPDINQTITFAPTGNWGFPTGTVWIKHFEMEMTNGVPESRRRLETRLLVKNPRGAYGVTYRWNAQGTSATLVGEQGEDETLIVHNGPETRTQVWRYPSRGECLTCHTREGGHALGFSTVQINTGHAYGDAVVNQIEAMSEAGYFSNPPSDLTQLQALAKSDDTNAPLEFRARSFFAANCSPCHQAAGVSTLDVFWDGRITPTLAQTHLLENSYIVPGGVAASRILHRLTDSHNLMPPVGTAVVNTNAVNLITAWVNTFPPAPWISSDLGNPAREGSSRHSAGIFSVSGSGTGIGSQMDQAQFLSQPLSGSVQLIAQISGPGPSNSQSEAGIMFRAGSSGADPFGMVFHRGDGSAGFASRRSAGAESTIIARALGSDFRTWYKLTREGSRVTGFRSSDGIAWTLVEQADIELNQSFQAGLAVSSRRPGQYSTSEFGEVSVLSVSLRQPARDASYELPAQVPLEMVIPVGEALVKKVSFYADEILLGEISTAPYSLTWTNGLAGRHRLRAVVTDQMGSQLATEEVGIELTAPPAQATLLSRNEKLQGTWQGHHGALGSMIAGDSTNLPAALAVSLGDVPSVLWQNPSADTRALQKGSGVGRIAAAWGAESKWSMDVSLLDGRLHVMTVYFLDWDNRGRSQAIELLDLDSGKRLDQQTLTNFNGGVYLSWTLRGRVRVSFSSEAAEGAVASGVFFDDSQNQTPHVAWVRPQEGQSFVAPTSLTLQADASDPDGVIRMVEFFANDVKIGEVTRPPYQMLWENPLVGDYQLVARATDGLLDTFDSTIRNAKISYPGSTARFLGTDDTTSGNWKGTFGKEGYKVLASETNQPSFVSLPDNESKSFIWEYPTTDGRALLVEPPHLRIAACWWDLEGFTQEVHLKDGLPHIVSWYFLDWDSVTREQEIAVYDPDGARVLDTQVVKQFNGGKYYRWVVQGSVEFKVGGLEGVPVASAVFVDPFLPIITETKLERGEGGLRLELSWTSIPGERYTILASGELQNPTWTPISSQTVSTSSITRAFLDLSSPQGQMFFRISVDP